MKHLSEKEQIRGVARSWARQCAKRKPEISEKLEKLNIETVTAKDVQEIIGNNSWVCKTKCDECLNETWDCVQLGEEPNYESRTANICKNCLIKALELLEKNK